MSVSSEIVADLNALHDLAEKETDPVRRRQLVQLRSRLARRDEGAKVSEAAELLGVSPPTVRSWIDAGVLEKVPRSSPARVGTLRLADVKRIVELLRAHGHDRDLLSELHRRLHGQHLLESEETAAGSADARGSRVVPISDDLRRDVAELGSSRLELDEDAIADICRRFHVRRLSVFGSATTEKFDPERSDVDFLVEFEDGAEDLFGSYFGLKGELEQIVGRPVDLVMPKSLENPFFAESVGRTRRDVYAA